ncbi:MAG TPA: heat shock protein HspQ, partial [Gemmatimonadales bacterium]
LIRDRHTPSLSRSRVCSATFRAALRAGHKGGDTALAPATILVYVPIAMNKMRVAKFKIGQVVKHRLFPFRGVIFDIDPVFNNTEEWYESIPAEVRPHKDQPFYHLLAENAETEYIAYVSEQNLLADTSGEPLRHPQVAEIFEKDEKGSYRPRNSLLN